MGRGRGGYNSIQASYKDSGGVTVKDQGAIFVAERYIEQGFESVFRQRHNHKTYDLSIKTSNDKEFIRNIEVKAVTSDKSSKLASNIHKAFSQLENAENPTVAIYLPGHSNCKTAQAFAKQGFAEASRKGWVQGKVEVWFNDKTCLKLN